MKTLQVIEKLVVIIGVGLAVFPLWAWFNESEDRAITRSAMRLAAYEYCFKILTKETDLVGQALKSPNWSPAAVEAAAYADEIAEEECGLFHQLAEQRAPEIVPPTDRSRSSEQIAKGPAADALVDASDADPGPIASASPPPVAPPAARAEPSSSASTAAAPDPVPQSDTATFEAAPPAMLAPDEEAPQTASDSAAAPKDGVAPAAPTGRLSRGDYVTLPICDGEAIALGRSRVMCRDGSTRIIDPVTYEGVAKPRSVGARSTEFDALLVHFESKGRVLLGTK